MLTFVHAVRVSADVEHAVRGVLTLYKHSGLEFMLMSYTQSG